MTGVIIVIIWVVSGVATSIVFANKGIPFTPANTILALAPVLNTLIAIKCIFFSGVFKEMKNTLKIVFKGQTPKESRQSEGKCNENAKIENQTTLKL